MAAWPFSAEDFSPLAWGIPNWTVKPCPFGGMGEVQKRCSPKEKLREKNSCTPINPKKYSCYGLKNFIQGIW